jgi:hypothetical protein
MVGVAGGDENRPKRRQTRRLGLFFFIHLLVGEGYTLATIMPTSIDVWIAVARHLS